MNKRAKELLDYGARCGFVNEGFDGRGHYLLRHPNGEVVKVACTPGDRRGDENNRAEMRRKSGVSHDGPNSGSYRKGVTQAAVRASAPIVATCARSRVLREYIRSAERVTNLPESARVGLVRARTELAVLNARAQREVVST